jgi:hypothetical protein
VARNQKITQQTKKSFSDLLCQTRNCKNYTRLKKHTRANRVCKSKIQRIKLYRPPTTNLKVIQERKEMGSDLHISHCPQLELWVNQSLNTSFNREAPLWWSHNSNLTRSIEMSYNGTRTLSRKLFPSHLNTSMMEREGTSARKSGACTPKRKVTAKRSNVYFILISDLCRMRATKPRKQAVIWS